MTESSPIGESVRDALGEPLQSRSPKSYFSMLVIGLGALGTLGIFILMVLINTDVVGRALFNSPVPGVPEMVRMGVVMVVFLQVGQSLAGGRFTRSDAIYSRILARNPRLGRAFGALFNLTGAVLMGLILAGEMPRFIDAIVQGQYVGHRGVFVAPRWPVDLTIVLGCAVSAVQFLLMAWSDLRGIRGAARLSSTSRQ